jgi:hypothetical protein
LTWLSHHNNGNQGQRKRLTVRGAGLSDEVGELDGVEGNTTVKVLDGVEGNTIVAVLDEVESSITVAVVDRVEGMTAYETGSTRTKSTMQHKKWFHTI